jgi:hypothetical protein
MALASRGDCLAIRLTRAQASSADFFEISFALACVRS